MSLFSGLFCGGAACSMNRQLPSGVMAHRRAEVVSTQGNSGYPQPQPHVPFIVEQEWKYRGRRGSSVGSGSFPPPPGASPMDFHRSGSTGNFQEVLAGHLPCTAAALGNQETAMMGHGLYVSMQRGMSYDQDNGLHSQARSFELPSKMPEPLQRRPAKIRAESPGRMIPASNYEGAPEDAIDEAVAQQCKALMPSRAKALLIRRIAPGEYEVDGAPVRFAFSKDDNDDLEVMVTTPGQEDLGYEPLSRYLPRAAETALARAPLDLELPAFPWSIDPLSKTTGARGNGPVEALGLSNISNTMHSMPPKALHDPTNLSKMMKPNSSMPRPPHAPGMPGLPPSGMSPSYASINPRAPRVIPRQPSMIVSGGYPAMGPPQPHGGRLSYMQQPSRRSQPAPSPS